MESIHVLEPTFHISAAPLSIDKPRLNGALRAGIPAAPGKIAARLALGLLDRLNIFSAPRIIGAECFFADNSTMAGGCR